ncbi:unnamed protein product [Phytophthora fragariaefolia]|uniref:Unnamed protein product n=1 Tax=Phytophthora fragariaefolia TaxID=1490495 RepID=A0A9W6X5B4_9STRA|nr:unnamed protein product [Phytophthora fragariaefolia]
MMSKFREIKYSTVKMARGRIKLVLDSEVTAQDLWFKSVWKELREQGWTRKPPPRSSLDDQYFYMLPGRGATGKEGLDFLRGELAVLEHYANSGPASPGTAELATEDKVVQQPDSPVLHAQPRQSPDFGKRPARRHVVNDPLIPTSPRVQRSSDSEGEEDHNSSGTGGDGSVTSASDSENGMLNVILHIILNVMMYNVLYDADDESHTGARDNDLLADTDDNLNARHVDESELQFGAIESGDSAEKDDVESGKYDSDEDIEAGCLPEDVVDDPEMTEAEITTEVLFGEQFLEHFGGHDSVLAGNLKNDVLREMSTSGWEDCVQPDIDEHLVEPYEHVDNSRSYPGLRQAVCCNDYHRDMLPLRVDDRYQRYRRKQRLNLNLPQKTRRDIQHEMQTMKPIMPHELYRFFGLLVARAVAPNREELSHHWRTTDVGAISRGCFGSVLSRDRFMEISRNLHFNSNADPRARSDRAGKIRKLVEVLQRRFVAGYVAPSHLAFDEAMLPSRSSFNKMRCSKKQHISDAHNSEMKSGPAAVVRNLLELFGPNSRKQGMRLIVIDRFYTSVALAIQLLVTGFYCVGTIMTNRLGYCKEVIEKKKTKPDWIPRGSCKIARSKVIPNMSAISSWDSRPVHFLCTGGSIDIDRVRRQVRAEKVEVPCPRVIKDYHTYDSREISFCTAHGGIALALSGISSIIQLLMQIKVRICSLNATLARFCIWFLSVCLP